MRNIQWFHLELPPQAWIYINETLWLISLSEDWSNRITLSDKNLWATSNDISSSDSYWGYYNRWWINPNNNDDKDALAWDSGVFPPSVPSWFNIPSKTTLETLIAILDNLWTGNDAPALLHTPSAWCYYQRWWYFESGTTHFRCRDKTSDAYYNLWLVRNSVTWNKFNVTTIAQRAMPIRLFKDVAVIPKWQWWVKTK